MGERGKLGAVAPVLAVLLLGACASQQVTIAPAPPVKYERLGQVTGSACGNIAGLWTSTYFLPIDLHGRMDNAYQRALASAPGATGLINVTYQEDWYWWLLATARCVTVKGEAIR